MPAIPLPPAVTGPSRHARMAAALRVLAIDAVETANSGHPGMPMGMADAATVLFDRHLRADPECPDWPNRDRFVLSAGHGSMLLYGLLHLTGHGDMPMAELRAFRQLGSRAAGHPEYELAKGIETTTGPLGQGLAAAVGMAIGERWLREHLGRKIIDHHVYVVAGDGCLMEGISQEAISLAGHLRLAKLIVLLDDNQISIDGPVSLADSTDQLARFKASGWAAARVDGHDPEAIHQALTAARKRDRPSLICCRTVIGIGAPEKQGTAASHGAPLGPAEAAAARAAYGWTEPPFRIPEQIRKDWLAAGRRSRRSRAAWEQRVRALPKAERARVAQLLEGKLPPELPRDLARLKQQFARERPKLATRAASQRVLEVVNACLPATLGGSADLTGSNNTRTRDLGVITPQDFSGRYLHWGIREHAMAAAMNGLATQGGIIPYGGTFLAFTSYAHAAMRLSALMGLRVIYVMTHDSIGLGEDGPTHQPVEHLALLRATPNLQVFRPADAIETAECWQLALETCGGPSVLALSRQSLPALRTRHSAANRSARGAYVMAEARAGLRAILIATGSEVSIALDARTTLEKRGIGTRVVSMPSEELFSAQSVRYRRSVLPPGPVRVAIEAASPRGWERWLYGEGGVESRSAFIGMQGFGASAPADALYAHFGIDAGSAARTVRRLLRR